MLTRIAFLRRMARAALALGVVRYEMPEIEASSTREAVACPACHGYRVWALDMWRPVGGLITSGYLPDHTYTDPITVPCGECAPDAFLLAANDPELPRKRWGMLKALHRNAYVSEPNREQLRELLVAGLPPRAIRDPLVASAMYVVTVEEWLEITGLPYNAPAFV